MAFAFSATARAQDDVLNELYGSGVHAFNSGDYLRAYNDLAMAVRSGSKDPRVFYYRGLAYLRLGRPQEAQADFKKGADLEMADSDRFYPVSKSLERIQGSARQQIERYRSRARLVAYQTRERQRYERYERIRKNEPNVLATPDEATQMPTPAREPAKKPAAEPSEELMPAEPMPEEPGPETPAERPEAEDPFGDKPEPVEEMPAEKPGDGDDADKEGAEEMPAEKPIADPDDPFAEDGDKKDAAEEMPAEKEGDDEPAEEMKDEADGDKPADDEKPAEEKKPADDDPFSK